MIAPDPIDQEASRLRAFVESIVNVNGPYPELNGTKIIVDAYAALNPVADILRNSLPVAKEQAPPVPQSLQDEISANHLRSLPAASKTRFFRETTTGITWEWRNGKMTIDGEGSIFKSPAEILECLDVVEVDEFGDVLELTASDIAAEKSDQSRE